MLKLSDLKAIVEYQRSNLLARSDDLPRDLLNEIPVEQKSHALIISGIRRCGKSTLLSQLIKTEFPDAFFLNFDTPRLYEFELKDFELLDLLIDELKSVTLCFDEIQVIKGWELYIRQKLDSGNRVIITGSNASLLSRELGTKLTGRHITKELFPFSLSEFIRFRFAKGNENSLSQYAMEGGFPEFVKTGNPDILPTLLDDILHRDIAVRHNIRDIQSLKHLLVFLISNVGNLVTATKLARLLSIKSTATVLDYFSYFEHSYLLALIPKFAYSYRAQIANPRKVYFIDSGMIQAATASFNNDKGRILENIIYWELRRQNHELYYFNENGQECDFVICRQKQPIALIQVCYQLTYQNNERETRGLTDAMNYFDLHEGYIITFNQNDLIITGNKKINILPAHEFLLNNILT